MSSNEQKAGDDIEQRMEASRVLQEDANAIRKALIEELTEKMSKLEKQIKDLDIERQDVQYKLAVLTGKMYDEDAIGHKDFQSKRHHVKDEAILALLIQNKGSTTALIQEYFHFSSATVCRRMDALLKAKKVTLEKRGTSKIWKVRS